MTIAALVAGGPLRMGATGPAEDIGQDYAEFAGVDRYLQVDIRSVSSVSAECVQIAHELLPVSAQPTAELSQAIGSR